MRRHHGKGAVGFFHIEPTLWSRFGFSGYPRISLFVFLQLVEERIFTILHRRGHAIRAESFSFTFFLPDDAVFHQITLEFFYRLFVERLKTGFTYDVTDRALTGFDRSQVFTFCSFNLLVEFVGDRVVVAL